MLESVSQNNSQNKNSSLGDPPPPPPPTKIVPSGKPEDDAGNDIADESIATLGARVGSGIEAECECGRMGYRKRGEAGCYG